MGSICLLIGHGDTGVFYGRAAGYSLKEDGHRRPGTPSAPRVSAPRQPVQGARNCRATMTRLVTKPRNPNDELFFKAGNRAVSITDYSLKCLGIV